jgi:polyferredoxin
MKRAAKRVLLRLLLAGAMAVILANGALAEQRLIPTPSFSAHPIPTADVPDVDSGYWQVADVGLLLAAMVLATYLALVRRSRRLLLVLSIASLIWFGFVREGCVCSVGSVQNAALAVGDAEYAIPAAVLLFFVVPLVFTIFFGRTFCAAVCPLGAVQELTAVRSVKVPRWIDQSLGLVPYVVLGAAVIFAVSGTAFVICRYDPYVAMFRLGGNANIMVFGGCILLIGLVVGRPYCRYLCPYGAVLSLLSRLSKWHLRIVPGECINCRLCEDACPYGAIQRPTVPQPVVERARGKRRLAWLLLAAPVIIALCAWLGTLWSVPLARLHPTFQLAEQVRLENLGRAVETTDASDAFRNTGRPAMELYSEALSLRQQYVRLGGWLGAWVGLVLSVKLIHLSVRRQRADYHPERAKCVSCGRCFRSCPVELVRLGLIDDVSEMVKETRA